jgi:Ca2+-binding RTX toxin-like protein
MKMIVAAVAALGLTGLAASAAQASTVTFGADGALVVTAAPGERNQLGLQAAGDESGRLVVYEGTPGLPVTGGGDRCEQFGDSVTCTIDPAAGVRLDLGDGDDWGYVSSGLPASMPVAIAGGPGDDKLQASGFDGQPTALDGGPGKDTLEGGSGTDTLVGGDGDDTLDGKAGTDRLDGGAGDDLLNGDGHKEASPDVIDGGPGYDRIESEWQQSTYSAPPVPLSVTLGGGADDGRPGEGDDIRNVERVITSGPSRMVGTEAAEHLEVFQITGASELVGAGGNDTLKGADGPDKLDGGAGDDDLDAGFGDDTIVGGPGRDSIAGDRRGGDCGPLWCKYPFGNDTIDARDGEVDSVMCGAGEDSVQADAADVVASDCEHVDRGGGAAAPTSGATRTPVLTATVGPTKLAKALANGLNVRVGVPGAGRVTAKAARASGSAKATKAGTTTVRLRFNTSARRALRGKRSVKLTIAVRFTPAAGRALDGVVKVTVKR